MEQQDLFSWHQDVQEGILLWDTQCDLARLLGKGDHSSTTANNSERLL